LQPIHSSEYYLPAFRENAMHRKRTIDTLSKDMIQEFDKRDAAAIAPQWTAEGEFIRNYGEAIRGGLRSRRRTPITSRH
jgi:hypothetical protein